jgi:ferritin
MFTEKVKQLLNEQIDKEFYSAYLYLYFANYYVEQGLNGFANWFTIQAQEERDHALLFIKYMQNNDIKVTFEAIGKPDAELKKHMDALLAALAHEQFVTASIHTIYEAAYEAKDFRTMQFWIGSSGNRRRRRPTPAATSKRWSSSVPTARVSICSIRS